MAIFVLSVLPRGQDYVTMNIIALVLMCLGTLQAVLMGIMIIVSQRFLFGHYVERLGVTSIPTSSKYFSQPLMQRRMGENEVQFLP